MRLDMRMNPGTRNSTLRITILALILAVEAVGTGVLPAFSVGENIDPPCAESLRWKDMDFDPHESSSPETVSNVILVMLDGVRWQEFLDTRRINTPLFPFIRSTLSTGGHIFPNDRVSNPYNISLPAYQSIFAGAVQDCRDNECGRITTETFPERLVRELKLNPKKVATIASWNGIACAVESTPKATFINAGDAPLFDGSMDGEHAANNRLQQNKKWQSRYYRSKARLDEHTYRHAMTYLRRHRPNFLFISFVDSDFYGHEYDYSAYQKALRQYDGWLKELTETLGAMGEYGKKTTLIVTTDHGRGVESRNWGDHGVNVPESGRIWTYIRLPRDSSFRIADESKSNSHVDIRPTIETLFGLQPMSCSACGASFIAAKSS
jgi:hypothetical protein